MTFHSGMALGGSTLRQRSLLFLPLGHIVSTLVAACTGSPMPSKLSDDFAIAFQQLTGRDPFPWQTELYRRFAGEDEQNRIPSVCRIPTGLGKTSLIAVWLIALRRQPALPRRLVYVVNRRTVVDQTTEEVERLRQALGKFEVTPHLGISTLRGQFADNREWLADPSRPSVICGTVDMIGSRLLFSGYRIGFKSRPLHAGFLGQDALLVHDEAHLEPAFQTLISDIERIQNDTRLDGDIAVPWPKLQAMALSATSRLSEDVAPGRILELTEQEKVVPESFPDDGSALTTVWRRLSATKHLHLHVADRKKQRSRIVELALVHASGNSNVIVFVRRVDDAVDVVAELQKELAKRKLPPENVLSLTGTMRGHERDQLCNKATFRRFLPEHISEVHNSPAYLVCTSAGEVGINLSADHLVCDLSTWESMVQRFGRVNRFGKPTDTQIDVVYPDDFADNSAFAPFLQRTLELLRELGGDASPRKIETLDRTRCEAAYAPPPKIPRITDILLDNWAMTSIRGALPGRPPVEPYLHGVTEWEPPRVSVAWRKEVEWLPHWRIVQEGEDFVPGLLEVYPLKPHELLNDTCERVQSHLQTLANTASHEIPVWIIDRQQQVDTRQSLQALAKLSKSRFVSDFSGSTILLPPTAGGLSIDGMLDGKAAYDEKRRDYDVADEWQVARTPSDGSASLKDKAVRPRQRIEDGEPPEGMVLVRAIRFDREELPKNWQRKSRSETESEVIDGLPEEDDETQDAPHFWRWYVQPKSSEESPGSSSAPILLDDHNDAVKKVAEQFVTSLRLPEDLKQAVILAAAWHDLGKRRERWQRSIGNPEPRQFVAKSVDRRRDKRWATGFRLPYRHEFGSLRDVLDREQAYRAKLELLSDEMQDVVLHLIAAHHGFARPHFTADGTQDPDLSGSGEAAAISLQATRRFTRLQRRYGRWGLAYLESLLRAADWNASANEVIPASAKEVTR